MRASPGAVLVLLAFTAAAAAEPVPRSKPGAALVWGAASGRTRAVAQAAAEDELRAAGWSLLRLAAEHEAGLGACFRSESPWPCAEPLLRAHELASVFALEVAREREQVRLTGQLGARLGERVTLEFRYCTPCSDDAALAVAARQLVRQLLAEGAVRNATTRLVVRTRPPGATIRLDGRMIDAPGDQIAAGPGWHTLVLQLAGYRSEIRTIRLTEGVTAHVEVALVAERGAAPATPPASAPGSAPGSAPALAPGLPRSSRRAQRRSWPLALAASGAVALSAGLVLFALDEDAHRDASREHRETYFDSAPAGVVVGLAGAAAASLGFALWLGAPAKPACAASCAPAGQSSPSPSAWISWSTTY